MNLPSWVSVKIGVSYDDSKGWRLKLGPVSIPITLPKFLRNLKKPR
jgi:hypothetical protein